MHTERKIKSQPLPVRFSDALLPVAQEFYDSVLSPNLQDKYERALHGVLRMHLAISKGFPIPAGYSESNLQHVVAGLQMAREYRDRYPVLQKSINFRDVQIIFGVHDCGEIVEAVGDVQPLDRTHADKVRKRLEPYAARTAVIAQIPNSEAQAAILSFYDRYIRDDPNDLDVQMARFIDKAQGTTRAAPIAFNVHNATSARIKQQIELHLWMTVPMMLTPATNLLIGLPRKEERNAMAEIILAELRILEKYGSKSVARAYMQGVTE